MGPGLRQVSAALLRLLAARSSSAGSSLPVGLALVLRSHPNLTGVPRPAVPALAVAAIAQPVPCADKAIVLVTLSIITLAVLSRDPPVLGRAHTLPTVTRPFPTAQGSVIGLTELLALRLTHVTCPRELAELPEPLALADAASAGTVAVTSTDLPVDVLTLAVVTLTVLPVDTAVPWRAAGTLPALALPSSKARQAGRSPAPLQTVL